MRPRRNYQTPGYKKAREEGVRSPLELVIKKQLDSAGAKYTFEAVKVDFTIPARSTFYRPDFLLANHILLEVKGEWTTEDRKKHKLIKEQHPDLDIRIVFGDARRKIGSTSQTSYALYCDRLGIPWAHRNVPQEWLEEPPTAARTRALKALSS